MVHVDVGFRSKNSMSGVGRVGEMETNAILGHGLGSFIKESMMERSDKFDIWIDNKSGNTSIVNTKKNIYNCYGSYNTIEYNKDDQNIPIKKHFFN